MKKILLASIVLASMLCSCREKKTETGQLSSSEPGFDYIADRFADIQVLRYEVKGFDSLSLNQKQLAYYLYQAGLYGRDIFYDQKYKHGLRLRKTLETLLENFAMDKSSGDNTKFLEYCKRFFLANGNHHHYSSDKMIPECSQDYFSSLVKSADPAKLPLEGKTVDDFLKFILPLFFDPSIDKKVVDLAQGIDHVKASCNHFYENVTEKEADTFYKKMKAENPKDTSPLGINSQLVKENGKLMERRWMIGGMYSAAIEKIVYWLEKALTVAENNQQKESLEKLIKYYRSGDPKDFDEHAIAWVRDTSSVIDVVNGFIEQYEDPLQKKGAFESIVSLKDFEATKRIAAIGREAQWFEDHSTIMKEHKKADVKGISGKVISVIGEVGDAAPTTPIGINLPNNEYIRSSKIGSKSVSLSNIIAAQNYAKSKSPIVDEFCESREIAERARKYGALAADLHVDMHEVIGHASGKINAGVGPTEVTLSTYAGVLEEGRADLVALYFILDQKLVDIGVMPSLEVGKAGYENYLMNGLMTQLNRIKPGDNLEEAHMRNRQMNAAWVLDHAKKDNCVAMIKRDGKTYIQIRDYLRVRELFGELLREIQRIKSEGDYEAGKNLVEKYGVKVDPVLHKEILSRYEKLNVPPYFGFIQPKLVPVMNGDNISDVKIEYPSDFLRQHLEYGKEYGVLPLNN